MKLNLDLLSKISDSIVMNGKNVIGIGRGDLTIDVQPSFSIKISHWQNWWISNDIFDLILVH